MTKQFWSMWRHRLQTLLLIVAFFTFNHNTFCYDDDAYVDEAYDSVEALQNSLSEAEEYVEDTFVVQTIDYDSTFAKKYQGESFQYREDTEMVFETTKKSGGILNLLLNLLMYLIIGAVVIYLIYFLVQIIRGANFQISKSVSAPKVADKNEVKVEQIDDVDFKQLISEAKRANDFKLAVRYYFLWYLKLLAAEKYIKWNKDKSNADYKNELRSTARLDEFSLLAYLYEWVWYGNVALDEEKFTAVESHFLSKIIIA